MSSGCRDLLLVIPLEFENNGHGVPYSNRFTIFTARFKLGQRFDYADGFGIKFLIYRTNDLDFTDLTILVNDKLEDNTSFNIVLGRICRILDIITEVSHERSLTSREPGHLFDRPIDLLGGLRLTLHYRHLGL